MAGERKLPAVGKVISGTHGYFWWNNSICYEITSFEAKIKSSFVVGLGIVYSLYNTAIIAHQPVRMCQV